MRGANRDTENYSAKVSDVWALGVILTNLITGRAPWHRAVLEDECYHQYIYHRSYLRACLPLSRHAHHVIRRCLDPNPSTRITIAMLSQEIKQMDSFYLSLFQIAMASNSVRQAAAHHGPLTRIRYPQACGSDTSSGTSPDTDGPPVTPPLLPRDPSHIEMTDILEGVGIGDSMTQPPLAEVKEEQKHIRHSAVQRMVDSFSHLFCTSS